MPLNPVARRTNVNGTDWSSGLAVLDVWLITPDMIGQQRPVLSSPHVSGRVLVTWSSEDFKEIPGRDRC